MTDIRVTTKKTLMEHLDRDWSAINRFLNGLSETQWTAIQNGDGWTIKDHVAHLTAWMRSVTVFLTGKPRHTGLEVTEALYLGGDLDAINDAIFQARQHDTLDQVRTQFQTAYDELYRLIQPLSDEDLNRPYMYYLPDEPGEGEVPPAINVIYGNTAHHYRTHQAWMEAMLVEGG